MAFYLNKYINEFRKVRICVIGDIMIDQFMWGDTDRISPEAPVPIVLIHRESNSPGGAANTACNISSLSGDVSLVGIIGDDDTGKRVSNLLANHGVNCYGVLSIAERPTTQKTRVVAKNQQLVRYDREISTPIGLKLEDDLLDYISKNMDQYDAVIISDYCKGTVTPRLSQEIIKLAASHKIPAIVDTKSTDISYFSGCTIITPNQQEARRISGLASIRDAGNHIQHMLGSNVLITQGADGMTLFLQSGDYHIPTRAREVFDVSGAGDTVAAALTLALASGASFEDAANLANHAAGVVVAKAGTATVTSDELISNLNEQ